MASFPFLDKLSVHVPVIKVAIMRRGFICSSLIGKTNGPGWHITGNIRLIERPRKRHISELLSDHSLSS